MLSYLHKNRLEAGVDEAGRGSLIGDVYASAVVWDHDNALENNSIYANWINDSKKLSKRKRLILKDFIEENAIDFSVSSIDNKEIDKINILNASLKAMKNALDKLTVMPEYILIDGEYFHEYYSPIDDSLIPHKCIIDGDATYSSIAVASILAKVYHDEHIQKLCDDNEELRLDEKYGLLSNMGYGTKRHLDGIKSHAVSHFHRMSYKPCKSGYFHQ